MSGDRAGAGAAYTKLLKRSSAPFQDQAVARFRVAELAAAHNPTDAAKQFLAINRNFPAHPLADEALKRAAPPKAAAPPELPPVVGVAGVGVCAGVVWAGVGVCTGVVWAGSVAVPAGR